MRTLLEFFLRYFDFLYLDARYRITNSKTGDETINAWLEITGPVLTLSVTNDRGQMLIGLAPTTMLAPENWFRLSIVRQYLDGFDETNALSAAEAVTWLQDNIDRIESLFIEGAADKSCADITALENANAVKYWGAPQG